MKLQINLKLILRFRHAHHISELRKSPYLLEVFKCMDLNYSSF